MIGQQRCQRCLSLTGSTTTSMFNTQRLCLPCKAEEREAPGYEAAVKAESEAVRSGNYTFPGVGLSPKDQSFLVERRAKRVS